MVSETMVKVKIPIHEKLSEIKADQGFVSFSRTIGWLIDEKEKMGSFSENEPSTLVKNPSATRRNLHDIEHNSQ